MGAPANAVGDTPGAAVTGAAGAGASEPTAENTAACVNNARGVCVDAVNETSEVRLSTTAARTAEQVTHCFTLSDPVLAWLIVNGKKTLENRTFRLGVGWYAVHVGKGARADVEAARRLRSEYPEMPEPAVMPRGCVYGACKIIGARAASEVHGERWYVAPYPWANVIGDAVRFDEPAGRAMRGNLGVVPLREWGDAVRTAAKRAMGTRNSEESRVEPWRRRPQGQDVLLGYNERAYASHTQLNGQWMGALFARCDIPAGAVIAEYRGPVMSEARARAEPEGGNQYMLTARRVRDGRLVTIDGTPTGGADNLAGYANYACDGAANARLSDEAGAPPPGHVAPTYVVIRAEAAVLAGTEIRIDYDLARRCAAMRGARRGKKLCTERTRAPRLPYQEQLLRQGATMDQLNDMTYRDVRWSEPPALAGVPGGSGEAVAGRVTRAWDEMARGHAGPTRELPARGGPERGRKRRNTASRWDGGTGAPGQDVTAAGQMTRADGGTWGGGAA